MKLWPVDQSHRIGLIVLVTMALLYLLTLDNGLRPDELTGGDLITHQYAQVEARPGNAPGYPLYTIGGWLWFHGAGPWLRGVLNPIQILSSYSTLWSLASLAVLYLILLRECFKRGQNSLGEGMPPSTIGGDTPPRSLLKQFLKISPQRSLLPLVPLLLTAFYGVTYFFWYYSVTTEQYTSAVFQTLLVIWLAFQWEERPRDSLLLALAFVSGTMLANMVTTLFILPPLLGFIFSRRGAEGITLIQYLKRPKLVTAAVGLALLPLLSYGYIYLRGAQHPEWRGAGQWPTTWAWFVDFMTIRQGRDELAPGLGLQAIFTEEFPWLMLQELTWPLFFGGLVGLAALGRRRALFLYSTLLFYFFFCWLYRFGNWFQVIIPAYPIFIIGVAAGYHALECGLKSALQDTRQGGFQSALLPTRTYPQFAALSQRLPGLLNLLVIAFLAGLLIYRFALNLPRANQHNLPSDTGLHPGWAILADQPRAPAFVVTAFEERVALQYLQTVWQLAPELTLVEAESLEPLTLEPLEAKMWYITRQAAAITPPGLQKDFSLHAAGQQLIALYPQPLYQLPAVANSLFLDFGGELQLLGWESFPTWPNEIPAQSGLPSNWQIALYWQPYGDVEVDYTISLRPLVDGQPLMKGNEPVMQDHQPVWGLYPTSYWRRGEIVRDVYALSFPERVIPEAFQVVVYQTTGTGFENLGEHSIAFSQKQP